MAIGTEYELQVHFSGMCLLALDGTSAKVMLPNPSQIGSSNHQPVLIIRDHEGLVGTPEQSFTLPGSSDEYGLWSLVGRDLLFESDYEDRTLRVQKGAIGAGWQPADPKDDTQWSNVLTLANIGELTQATSLRSALSPAETGPVVPLEFGKVFALPPAEAGRRSVRISYRVAPNPQLLAAKRAMSDRIAWTLPPTRSVTRIVLKGRNRTEIQVDDTIEAPIMISNVAVGACRAEGANHFDVYYQLVNAQRTPSLDVVDKSAAADDPHYPEICRCAVLAGA